MPVISPIISAVLFDVDVAMPSTFAPDVSAVSLIAPASFAAVISVLAAEHPLKTTDNRCTEQCGDNLRADWIYHDLSSFRVAEFRTPLKGWMN